MKNDFSMRVCAIGLLTTVCMAASGAAFAQLVPRKPVIGAPIVPQAAPPRITSAPSGVVFAENHVPATVELRWNQPVTTAQYGQVDPPLILICVQDPAIPCTWQAHSPAGGVWSGPATSSSFTRTANFTRSPFGGQWLESYSYRATLTLPNTFFDRPLKVSVAACVDANTQNCSFGSTVSYRYSTKNVSPDGFNFSFFYKSPRFIDVNALASNNGTTESGPFTSEVLGMTALMNPANKGTCETDPNRAGLVLSDFALLITNDGQRIQVGTRRTGAGAPIDTAGLTIVGISTGGPQFTDGPPESSDKFLQPGDSNQRVSTHRIRVRFDSEPIPAPGTMIAVAGVSRTDFSGLTIWSDPALNNRIVEFNEDDNGRGRCSVMIW